MDVIIGGFSINGVADDWGIVDWLAILIPPDNHRLAVNRDLREGVIGVREELSKAVIGVIIDQAAGMVYLLNPPHRIKALCGDASDLIGHLTQVAVDVEAVGLDPAIGMDLGQNLRLSAAIAGTGEQGKLGQVAVGITASDQSAARVIIIILGRTHVRHRAVFGRYRNQRAFRFYQAAHRVVSVVDRCVIGVGFGHYFAKGVIGTRSGLG